MGIPGENEGTESTFDFLAHKIYRPGYMTLASADYEGNTGIFGFNLIEPPVTRGSLIRYMTPRGLHICLSQAGYALAEYMAKEERLGARSVDDLRRTFLESRLRIIELFQRFRKEIELGRLTQGVIELSRLRLGQIPLLKLGFEFEGGAVSGYFTSVIAPEPITQLNQYALRI